MSAVWQTVAARSEGLGTDPVVAVPSGTQNGDLLVAVGVCGAGQTITAPAGWTTHGSSLGTQAPLWTRIASSEPANYTFVTSGSVSSVVQITRISGQAASSPIDAASGHFTTTGANVIPSLTSAGANRLLFQMVVKLSNTTYTEPVTATPRYDTTAASQNVVYAGADEIVGAGATGTRTWLPTAGVSPSVGYMLAIAPVTPNTGSFTGSVDWTGTNFNGQQGPGEGAYSGGYDWTGSFTGEAPGVTSGAFAGSYDWTGSFTGSAPTPPVAGESVEGGRRRKTGRK